MIKKVSRTVTYTYEDGVQFTTVVRYWTINFGQRYIALSTWAEAQ